jgi:hypothetical protein
MLNKNAKKWVKALRSGKYKQGNLVLHNLKTDSFCCLGVACDLATKEGVFTSGITIMDDGAGVTLPRAVQKWLRLSTTAGKFKSGQSLVGLNDKENFTFPQIATVIESEPQGLFLTRKR